MPRPLTLLTAFALTGRVRRSQRIAGNYVIYLQGRGWASWNGETVSRQRLDQRDASPSTATRSSTAPRPTRPSRTPSATYCSGGNSCIIHCYSAGCLRMLKATYDLRAGGNSLPGLLYSEASGSAAGGTKLAEVSTQGLTSLIAKLIGQQEKVDKDHHDGRRAQHVGLRAEQLRRQVLWQFGGYVDICKSLLFFKSLRQQVRHRRRLSMTADGVVGMDSYSGHVDGGRGHQRLQRRQVQLSPSTTAGRIYDGNGNNLTPCTGANRDHCGRARPRHRHHRRRRHRHRLRLSPRSGATRPRSRCAAAPAATPSSRRRRRTTR